MYACGILLNWFSCPGTQIYLDLIELLFVDCQIWTVSNATLSICLHLQIFASLAALSLYFHCRCKPATKFTGNIYKGGIYQTILLLSFVTIDSMVSPDAWPISNYYKLISTLSREANSRVGEQQPR